MSKHGMPYFEYWNHRSRRERFLAVAVVGLLFAALFLGVARQMLVYQEYLDRSIVQLEENLLNRQAQADHVLQIETQFVAIRNQHASHWSEAEIRDRLKQEILRLAQKNPPPLDDKGIPVVTAGTGEPLVVIPGLGSGTLSEKDAGVKQYRLTFSLMPTQLENIVLFLKRLQESSQVLLIEELQLRRLPLTTTVAADIAVTRLVVDLDQEGNRDS